MKIFPSGQNKWIQPQMESILTLLSATQGSDVALRAHTVLGRAWGWTQGEGGNGQLWYLAWGLKGEMWVAKADHERDHTFSCQWFHDRECDINFFWWECQLLLPHLPLPLFSFCTPKPAQECLSASLFTGATHKLREVVNQVFPSPFSSYGYTDLQHIVSLSCLGSGLTHMVLHGNRIAKLLLWWQSPTRELCPRRRLHLLAPCVYIHGAVGCIRATFAWRHSRRALKRIESYSKQANTGAREEELWKVLLLWNDEAKYFGSEVFRASVLWKV